MFSPSPSAAVRSLSSLLRLAAGAGSLRLAHRAHARAFPIGLHRHPVLSSALISAYSRLGFPSLSRLVFDSAAATGAPSNIFLWNALLAAYSRAGLFIEPLAIFRRMRTHQSPDHFTLAILAKASAELVDSGTGRGIHSLVIRLGFGSDTVMANSLILLYFRCGSPHDARQVFDEIPARSVASWNVLISELVSLRDGLDEEEEVWKVIIRMQMEGVKPDGFTVTTILPLCSWLRGREIHCFVLRNDLGLGSDFHVGSCLIDMYSKSGHVDFGRRIFDGMASKNLVAWTAMIAGYVENGDFKEALRLFRVMQFRDGLVPNKVTLVSVLPAIGSLASLVDGKQVHSFAIRADLHGEVSLNNALIDMYSKCGSLNYARHIFDDESWHKDVISWSSMISCYGIHGKGKEAIVLFNEMCSLGVKLDQITSLAVLSACDRVGLISEGVDIYNSLVKNHGVFPSVEMCSCMVDMLGRAGQLNQAVDFINSMPVAPSSSVWGALFGASVIHNNQKMQDLASRFLLQSEPENPSNYVSLSNLHASSGRWDCVEQVRTRMKERGLRKMTGYSWINVNRW
ncbi:pentatricopeptide repeat-containing protein At3g12770-like [Phoenix dactylifera]|uniref:Pentatricopeptide repeat-containing protein At3g12770-like n=1 Tax=Phoenix dactylifera TaxID=42345 RepID=A0A8B9A6K1_PHODC|nr:pentatricopeptide repeat-containing protein At3g12770-like [Phoenix dactylifera]